jgi:hypothetical protein
LEMQDQWRIDVASDEILIQRWEGPRILGAGAEGVRYHRIVAGDDTTRCGIPRTELKDDGVSVRDVFVWTRLCRVCEQRCGGMPQAGRC